MFCVAERSGFVSPAQPQTPTESRAMVAKTCHIPAMGPIRVMKAVPWHGLTHQLPSCSPLGNKKLKSAPLLTAAAVEKLGLMDVVLRDIMSLLTKSCC